MQGLAMGVTSGVLHAVAMALRKEGGARAADKEGCAGALWLAGCALDFMGGVVLMSAMPFVTATLLLPTLGVSQMGTGCFIGVWWLREPGCVRNYAGFACAVLGVILLGAGTDCKANVHSVAGFWAAWTQLPFLRLNGCLVLLLAVLNIFADRCTVFLFLSAWTDSLQFLASRMLATVLVARGDFLSPGVFAAGCLKVVCVLLFLAFQQRALESSLSRVAGLYPLVGNLMPCILAASFYDEHLEPTPGLLLAALLTLLGVRLLSPQGHVGELACAKSAPLLGVQGYAGGA